MRDNIREFGSLLELSEHNYDFQLVVKELYDPDEVAAYIRTMGADDTDDLTAFAPACATGGETEEE